MGKVKQGTKCTVEGCDEAAVRSFPEDKVKEALHAAGAEMKTGRRRREYLCQKHYKAYKKQTRKDKKIEKWRYGA